MATRALLVISNPIWLALPATSVYQPYKSSDVPFICVAAATTLVVLLCAFDGKAEPSWAADIQLSTALIAIMSIYRIALKAIIESCVSQGAWIWVSGFRKGKTEARLEDFKMFDEASRETSLMLSTKAAIYDGIIASTVSDVPVLCETGNCTWPVFPSLAVCGICAESTFSTSCNSGEACNYSMPSGTSILSTNSAPFEYYFTVAPSNGSSALSSTSSKAIISIFDIMSSAKTPRDNLVRAHQCGLWFCLQSYNVTVTNGVVNRSLTIEWSKSEFVQQDRAGSDEYVFLDIPPQMNAKEHARYSVSLDSLEALRAFMDQLTLGNASKVAGTVRFDSDWIQAIESVVTKDLSGWISRLALSLTNNIQLTGTVQPNGDSEYSGTAYIMAPHLKVNWYWVAYPVSLMILAFLYLMQTMLFCHVSKTIHAQVRDGMDVPKGLNRRVGRTEVELIRGDNGEWVFTEPRNH
ncbi:hypothetical protein O1611_g8174 [Lasiodiplodia mahajangana]|uniref:Uncharacterized protein n=1 Tax=Lasiodiplodia mahajangana TaxID=1108764 RepID=A0ACC2JDB2_9PEZI|nr:hypothetical protein O1611_g8174 [Lasiodiplodia mahajangana]